MPAFYDYSSNFGNMIVEQQALYNQLPFFLVRNEVTQFAKWNVFDQMFGKINWQANEGPIMKGITLQRSPVGRAVFFPNSIQVVANKDIYQPTESVEQAQVYAHKYETFQFNFLPNFQAYLDHIKFADNDIVEKIAVSNNQFIETNLWYNYTNVYLCGTGVITGCPTQMGNIGYTAANSKNANWLIATTLGGGGVAGVQQGCTLRDMFNAQLSLGEDFGAPPFAGMVNMPKDNEGLKEKFVMVGSTELFLNWTYDPDVQILKPLDLNILFEQFQGLLFGKTTYKFHKYPLRYNTQNILDGGGNTLYAAGTFIPPEIFDATDNKWKPNPYWTSLVSAPFEIAHLLGDSIGKSIKVGPPPKEFSSKQMSGQKFYSMKWNGEVETTDQVLIANTDGTYSLNTYGENLKLQSKCTHGWLVGERRFGMAIILKRTRPAKLI